MVGSSLMTNGWAQKGGTVRHTSKTVASMQVQEESGFSVTFVSLSDGANVAGQHSLDLGSVSYAAHSQNPDVQVRDLPDRLVVSTNIGLAVQGKAGHLANVTLLAALAFPDAAHVLRLDGVKLATTTQVIQAQVTVNKTSAHRLEIEIPTALTEKDAAVHNSIIFQVVPN
jgi:hypothetical protein